MQIQKEDIRENIIETSKLLFFEKGYIKTKISDISKKSGIPVGNIYNYFDSKDSIFYTCIENTLKIIDKWFLEQEKKKNMILDFHSELILKELDDMIDFIVNNKVEINLIFNISYGTNFEYIPEKILKRYFEVGKNQMSLMNYKNNNYNISNFILKQLISLYFRVLVEVTSNDYSKEEIKNILKELINFLYSGSYGLLKDLKIYH